MNQVSVDIPGWLPPLRHKYYGDLTIEERFELFHRHNPQVASALKKMAFGLREKGVKRFGMKALFEVLRYQSALTTSGDPYKLNNNFTAFYDRLLMERHPELDGFFLLREGRLQ